MSTPRSGVLIGPEPTPPVRQGSRLPLQTAVVLAALPLGVLASLWQGPALVQHVTRDPEFCLTCHSAAAPHLAERSHQGLVCADCHSVRFVPASSHYLLYELSGGARWVAEHAPANRQRCGECHQAELEGARPIARTAGHRTHVFGKPGLACTGCHGPAAHVYPVDRKACARCHDQVKVYHKGTEPNGCLSCHRFGALAADLSQTASFDCRSCHGDDKTSGGGVRPASASRAPDVTAEHMHGGLDACQMCHHPHRADPKQRVLGQDCSTCHRQMPKERHQQVRPDEFDCTTCHSAHSLRGQLRGSCAQCHEQSRADRTHLASRHEGCTGCHVAHEFIASEKRCPACHQKSARQLASWGAGEHRHCLNCHAPHAATSPSNACGSCHRRAVARGHEGCMTCHEPHLGRADTKGCASCHEEQANLLASNQSKHGAACANCHAAHDPGSDWKSCSACHEAETRLVASGAPEAHRRCSECHQPHAFSASDRACRRCHQRPAGSRHGGACDQCHQSHGPREPKRECQSCHALQASQARKGKHECSDCHAAHEPRQDWWNRCAKCHNEQVVAVQGRGKTHARCASCHQPHQFAAPACTSCHAARAAGHALPGHQDCVACHSSHSRRAPTRRDCLGCHRDRVDHHPQAKNCAACHPFR